MPEKKATWRIEKIGPKDGEPKPVQKALRFKPDKEHILRVARAKGNDGEGMYTVIKEGDENGAGEVVEFEHSVTPDMLTAESGASQAGGPGGNVAYLPPPPQAVAPAKLSLEEAYLKHIEAGDRDKAEQVYVAMRLKEDAKQKERSAMMGFADDGGQRQPKVKTADQMSFDELIDSGKKRKFLQLVAENKLDEALAMGGSANPQAPPSGFMQATLPTGVASTGDAITDAAIARDYQMKAWLRLKGVDPDHLATGGMSLHQNPDIAKWQLEDMKEARQESRRQQWIDRIFGLAQQTVDKVGPLLDRIIPKQAGLGDINQYLQQQGQAPPVAGAPQAYPYPSPMLPTAPQRAVVQQAEPVYVGPGAAAVTPRPPAPAMTQPVQALPRVPVQATATPEQVQEGATEVLGILDETVNAIVENSKEPGKAIPEDMIRTLHSMGGLTSDRAGKLLSLRQRGVRNLVSQYAQYITQLEAFPAIPAEQQKKVMMAVKVYRPETFAQIVNIREALTKTNPGYDPSSLNIMIKNQQMGIALPVIREIASKLKVLTTPHGINWIERAVEEVARLHGSGATPVAAAPPMSPPPTALTAAPPPITPPSAREQIEMLRNPQSVGRVPKAADGIGYGPVPKGWEEEVAAQQQELISAPGAGAGPQQAPSAPEIAPKAPEPAPAPQTEVVRIVDPAPPVPAPVAVPAPLPEVPKKPNRRGANDKPPCEHVNERGKRCGHGWQVEVDGHKYCAPHGKLHRSTPPPPAGGSQ